MFNYLPLISTKYNKLYFFNLGEIIRRILKSTNISIKELSKEIEKSDRLVYYWLLNIKPISIEDLDKIILLSKEKSWWDIIFKKMSFVSYGSSKKAILPKKITKNLLYFIGVLAGDGCICSDKETVLIFSYDKNYLEFLKNEVKQLFNISAKISSKENCFVLIVYSKPVAIYLNTIWNFPLGKKMSFSQLISVLEKLPLFLQINFCSGFLDTDGGTLKFESIIKGNKPYFEVAQSKRDILEFIKNTLIKVDIFLKGPYNYPIEINGKLYNRWRIRTDKIKDLKILVKYLRQPDKLRRLKSIINLSPGSSAGRASAL